MILLSKRVLGLVFAPLTLLTLDTPCDPVRACLSASVLLCLSSNLRAAVPVLPIFKSQTKKIQDSLGAFLFLFKTESSTMVTNITKKIVTTSLILPMVLATNYAGTYRLTGGVENSAPISIPEGNFLLRIDEPSPENQYKFNIKVGNSLRSQLTVNDDNTASVGSVLSTRMLPPPPIFELEKVLSRLLPTTSGIDRIDSKLLFKGSDSTLEFEATDS